jgi:hypothetical protein
MADIVLDDTKILATVLRDGSDAAKTHWRYQVPLALLRRDDELQRVVKADAAALCQAALGASGCASITDLTLAGYQLQVAQYLATNLAEESPTSTEKYTAMALTFALSTTTAFGLAVQIFGRA